MKLVTFLGTGNYQLASYQLFNTSPSVATCYVQVAFCDIWANSAAPVEQIDVIATEQAKEKHGASLQANLAACHFPDAQFRIVPRGESNADFWTIFEVMRTSITGDHVALDITHGFRSQPFFASAVLGYLASLGQLPEQTGIYYGEYSTDAVCPIWDLSSYLELMQWSSAIEGFVKYGRWKNTDALARNLEGNIRRNFYQSKQVASAAGKAHSDTPTIKIRPFLNAMDELSDALDTLRIPHIIRGTRYHSDKHNSAAGHAELALQKLDECKASIQATMPPLSPLLEQLQQVITPMVATDYSGESGLAAQHAIARQLHSWHRTTDASVAIREASVSKYLTVDELDSQDISDAQKRWETLDQNAQSISGIRNDLMHGGWRPNAIRGGSLKKSIGNFVADFDVAAVPETEASAGKVLIVSRHSGAVEWLRRQGYRDTTVISHLDISLVNKGDIVIGTLPLHQAAQIAARKAQFLFIEMNIPERKRGAEISADEMDQYGAKLQEYSVRVVNRAT